MKFLIFDIDGTLTDSKNVDDRCFVNAFLKVFNLDISNEDWSKLKNVTDWGITEEIIGRELGRKPSVSELNSLLDEHINLLTIAKSENPNQFNIVDNAIDFLKHLNGYPDFKLGIATGAWEQSARLKLAPFNLDLGNIPFATSSKFISRHEITQDVILQMTTIHGKADSIIYFGDGEWDYQTCQKIGIRFIGIDCNKDGKLTSLGARDVFQDYTYQDRIIKKIMEA